MGLDAHALRDIEGVVWRGDILGIKQLLQLCDQETTRKILSSISSEFGEISTRYSGSAIRQIVIEISPHILFAPFLTEACRLHIGLAAANGVNVSGICGAIERYVDGGSAKQHQQHAAELYRICGQVEQLEGTRFLALLRWLVIDKGQLFTRELVDSQLRVAILYGMYRNRFIAGQQLFARLADNVVYRSEAAA